MTVLQREGQKANLLYLSPVIPSLYGNGLAMRAGMVLELLASRYRVYLLIRPLYPAPVEALPDELVELCEAVATLPPILRVAKPGGALRRAVDRLGRPSLANPFPDVSFSIVHVFRLAMLRDALRYRVGAPVPEFQVDLDELESRTQHRLAALYSLNGDRIGSVQAAAREEEADAEELAVLRTANRVFLCSDLDRRTLIERGGRHVMLLPNVVRLPCSVPARESSGVFTFLFVGTLGYYPNEDALQFFCQDVLPILRAKATREFRISIVGRGATPAVESLTEIPEVELQGMVPDLSACYGNADVVIVPLRAGGGTRIKVLEAFAHRRPVVSTTLGCEGLSVCGGEHVLLADTPLGLAEHCLRLMLDSDLRNRLVARAYALLRERYTLEALAPAFHAQMDE